MKKFIGMAFALALGGCATTPSPDQISSTAKQIQQYTRTACSFVPTIQSLAQIISASSAVSSAFTIANDICAAVTTRPLADGGPRAVKVYGVPVRGSFVR